MAVVESGEILSSFPEGMEVIGSHTLSDGERWYVGPSDDYGLQTMPGRLLYSAEEIDIALDAIAQAITDQVPPRELCIVALAKGAVRIRDGLVPKITARNLAYPIDRLQRTIIASSYHLSTKSGDDVERRGSPGDVRDKTVIILDDILDTGKTIKAVREDLLEYGAKKVRCATLLTKAGALEVDIADLGEEPINGITIPNLFVVGHGIDWAEQFRELDEIVGLDPQRIVRIIQKEVV
jgi:hypoxanthine phosphoribosyltransferase